MKLQRFTAPTNQKAILMIHEKLGAEALIYSTRSIPEGVEILAALPHSEEEFVYQDFTHDIKPHSFVENQTIDTTRNNENLDPNWIEKINSQMSILDASIKELAKQLSLKKNDDYQLDDEQTIKRNQVFYHMHKLGFRGKFCHEFINDYLWSRKISNDVDQVDIENALFTYIKTEDDEFIHHRNIVALIGPTGVGKTTTIVKLAKRYITKYGSESVGIITTDYHDVTAKNKLLHYSHSLHVDLEFVTMASELALALETMKDKNLILIDTHGVSQRDVENVTHLLEMIESQGDKISAYLTLPCNIQEQVLDDIVKTFHTRNLRGCILTKVDESITIAPALSISMLHKIPIAYLCNGQNINKHIEFADANKILSHVVDTEKHKNNPNLAIEDNRFNRHKESKQRQKRAY